MIDEKKLIEYINIMMKSDNVAEYNCEISGEEIIELILDMPKVDEWIPVSERLPKCEDKRYLCLTNNGYISIYNFSKDLYKFDESDFIEFANKIKQGFYDYNPEWGFRYADEVIAWMPLPEPYKGGTEC